MVAELNKLNPYVKKNREFVRYFLRGATELVLDSNDRLNLPKKLMEFAGLDKEAVLFAHGSKIELWSQERYNQLIDEEPGDFAELAEEVMGKINSQTTDNED
jgi:MraZ protein